MQLPSILGAVETQGATNPTARGFPSAPQANRADPHGAFKIGKGKLLRRADDTSRRFTNDEIKRALFDKLSSMAANPDSAWVMSETTPLETSCQDPAIVGNVIDDKQMRPCVLAAVRRTSVLISQRQDRDA